MILKNLYKIEDRKNKDNISHIKVFLNIEPEDTPKSKSDTKSDTKSDKEIVEGSIVEWTIKNGETFQGEVIEITKKR